MAVAAVPRYLGQDFTGVPPGHRFGLYFPYWRDTTWEAESNQKTAALYWQQTVGILSTTDVSFGARIQNTRLNARDTYDPTAPTAFSAQAFPLRSTENHAMRNVRQCATSCCVRCSSLRHLVLKIIWVL